MSQATKNLLKAYGLPSDFDRQRALDACYRKATDPPSDWTVGDVVQHDGEKCLVIDRTLSVSEEKSENYAILEKHHELSNWG